MKVEPTDLRDITRDPEKVKTVVRLDDRVGGYFDWLIFGQAQVRNDPPNICWLSAYLTAGVTDIEHDSAYALRLPLIGLSFDSVMYHQTRLTAWIDPHEDDWHSDFRVPRPGYNPMALPDAVKCESEHCEPHIIVPEGHYLPPFDKELFDAVRGKRISIVIMPEIES